jgi:pyruvate/2-oxoglutarate/acetoin dehydrogenase E1 component
VAEEMQMGISVGLAIDGFVPISIFPRWNFILLGMNQLINHLDRMPQISNNGYPTKVIIRTSIGSERPLHPQYQHVGDFSEAIAMMLHNTDVVTLEDPAEILPAYRYAYERTDGRSTIIAEYGDFYSEK